MQQSPSTLIDQTGDRAKLGSSAPLSTLIPAEISEKSNFQALLTGLSRLVTLEPTLMPNALGVHPSAQTQTSKSVVAQQCSCGEGERL